MTKTDFLDQFFTPEILTKYLTSYILYYQISLGYNIYESLQDMEVAKERLQSLNLTLEPNQVIMNIFLLSLNNLDDNIFNNLDQLIQKEALLHSLNDFIKHDDELLNKQRYKTLKTEQIIENNFLTTKMQMQFLQEYPAMYKHYKKTIDHRYTQEIREIFSRNFLK